jgi:hypothetical protein
MDAEYKTLADISCAHCGLRSCSYGKEQADLELFLPQGR